MKILLFILLILPICISAQIPDHFNDYQLDTTVQYKFGIRSFAYNNSTALTANVLNNVMYGGRIEQEEKDRMLERANPINNSGSIWNTSIYFSKRIDSLNGKFQKNTHLFFSLSDKQENLGIFTEQALKLVLNGNKQFAGQTISLDPIQLNNFQYKKLQVGVGKNFDGGNGISLGVSFLYGQKNTYGVIERLDASFSDLGDRISADAEINLYETESTGNYFAYNGAGASIDIQGRFDVQLLRDSSNTGSFNFSITDLGFINWHGTSTHTKVDTFYSYTGVYIENIFDPNSSVSNDPTQIWDSISQVSKKSYTLYTPATLHFYLYQKLKKTEITIGGAHRTRAYFYPYFYGRVGYFISSVLTITAQLNAGGYGSFGGGLELKYNSKNLYLVVGSTNIEGFLDPSRWAGQSIYLQAAFKL